MAKADETATWAIELVDGTSATAESAAAALSKLKSTIDADTKALAQMQAAMRNLQGGTVVNVAQFRELKAQIDAKKQAIAQAQSSYLSLGGTFGDLKRKSDPARSAFQALAEQAKAVGGPVGALTGRFEALKGMIAGGAIALGVVAITAALVALTVAAVAATAALLKYGIAQANARRGELLRLEGLTKMRNWWGIPAGNAVEMQGAIDKVSSATALGRDKLEDYATQLYRAGIRGENFALALEGAAIKGAVLGDEAAKGFMGWAQAAALGGGSVKRLTDDVRARFGGVAKAQLLDWNVQFEKMRSNIGSLFAGLKIERALEALRSVLSVFDKTTITGKALQTIVQAIFQPLTDAAASSGIVIRRFFQGMIIGALTLTVAILTVRNWFRRTFGDSSLFKGWDLTMAAIRAGQVAVGLLAAGFALLGGIMASAAVGIAVITAPIWATVLGLYRMYEAGKQVVEWFQSVDWSGIGKAIAEGLADGLIGWRDTAIDAVKDLGGALLGALKSALSIASPSKAFARLGVEIPAGVEAGINEGAPDANAAARNMITPPGELATRGGNTAPGRGESANRQITISFGDINVNSSGNTGPAIAGDIRRELESMLEGVLVQLGGAV